MKTTAPGQHPHQPMGQSVSVVIATRDRPQLLRRAIDSVISQQHPHHVEVVVVFDRSEPDRSLEMQDPQRRIVVTTNDRSAGLAGARNTGIAKAANQWVAFCDDDDEWLPGKLASQFRALESNPSAVVATTGIYINYRNADTARIPDAAKLTFHAFLQDRMTEVHPSSILVSKSALTGPIGLIDETLPGSYGEDYDWLLRAARVSRIAVADQPLVRVYWHGASFFFEKWKTIDEALHYLTEKYPEFEEHRKGLARIRGQQSVAQAAMGQRRRAAVTMVETVKLNWKEKRVPVALLIMAGLPAGWVLKAAHHFGKGL